MYKKIAPFFLLVLLACQSSIKNENPSVIVEEGTDTSLITKADSIKHIEPKVIPETADEFKEYLGYWVGYFMPDINEEKLQKEAIISDGVYWARENKITVSVDYINDSIVKGHSVVAGNERPFEGIVKNENGILIFDAKEPGDDKYDGEFNFRIEKNKLNGTWKAYKNIQINKRKYTLEKKQYHYNPDQMLDSNADIFIDWENFKKEIIPFEDEDEFEGWESYEFAMSTDKIYEINASNTKLTQEDLENLSKGDLKIIRNTIYARHGYSFKNRPMRVFFDVQEWYIPTTADIKADFTQIEKDNIDLLLKYEKNAEEYYDSFGR